MKLASLVAAALLVPIMPVHAGTGVPPACEAGPFTNKCLDFGDASQEGLVRYRLDHDQDVGSGAAIAHRSEAQKAEVLRLFKALLKVERENTIMKYRKHCSAR